jgi:hypothetical protein
MEHKKATEVAAPKYKNLLKVIVCQADLLQHLQTQEPLSVAPVSYRAPLTQKGNLLLIYIHCSQLLSLVECSELHVAVVSIEHHFDHMPYNLLVKLLLIILLMLTK